MFNYPYQSVQNIIFVTEAEARAYILPSNSQVLLMDKDQPVFYIKTTDSLGQSTLRIFDFTERQQIATTPETAIEELKAEIAALKAQLTPTKEGTNNG